MNVESLKHFLTLEKYNSFSLAAEELCISQSSLSKHIKKLETNLIVNFLKDVPDMLN